MKRPCVYSPNRRNGTLYVGVTSDLLRRVWEHRSSAVDGFTERYSLAEFFETMADAILREKQIREMAPSMEDAANRRYKPILV